MMGLFLLNFHYFSLFEFTTFTDKRKITTLTMLTKIRNFIVFLETIGPLQLEVTWYKIQNIGEQKTPLGNVNKENSHFSS